ncbi:MAG: class B sortase [Oscillospiraceae bacterium]|nr:class B sortase [Oscillospiraceae bacterium]
MKKFIYTLLTIVFVGIFAYAAWQLISTIVEYEAGDSAYEGLNQYVSIQTEPEVEETQAPEEISPDTTGETTDEPESTDQTEATEPLTLAEQAGISVDFDSLLKMNQHTAGWLYIADTKINYPVVQAYDNMYYLRRLFDGTRNTAGCLFVDERCAGDFSELNSIIYGHNMRNGSMFADLAKYKKQDYFDEHPEGLLLTPDGDYRIVFFSGYVLKVSGQDAWRTSFTESLYEEWLEDITEKSMFECDIVPETTDRILTLSTCSYEFANARFVLHGILVPEETEVENAE